MPARSAAVRVLIDVVALIVAEPAVWDVGSIVNCEFSLTVNINGLITKFPLTSWILFAIEDAIELPAALALISTIEPLSILPIW